MNYKVLLTIGLALFGCSPHVYTMSKKKQPAAKALQSPTDDPGCWGKKGKNKKGGQYQQPTEQKAIHALSAKPAATPTTTSSAPQASAEKKNNHYVGLKPSPRHLPKSSPRAGLNTVSGTPRAKIPPPPPPDRPSPSSKQNRRQGAHRRSTRTVNEQLLEDAGLFSGDPNTPSRRKKTSRQSQESIYASLVAVGLADSPETSTHTKHKSIYEEPAPKVPTPTEFFAFIAALEIKLFPQQNKRQVFNIDATTIPVMDQLVNYIDMYKFHMPQKGGDIQQLMDLDQQSHMYRLAIHNFKYTEATARAIGKSALEQMQHRTLIEEVQKEKGAKRGAKPDEITVAELVNGESTAAATTDESQEPSTNSNSASSLEETIEKKTEENDETK